MNRRQFLKTAALGAAAPLFHVSCAHGDPRARAWTSPYRGFKMGAQSYSLRNFNLDSALERFQQLGLHYAEFYGGHFGITTDEGRIAAFKEKLAAHEILPYAFGVERFTANEADNRRKFQFGKLLGLKAFSADPDPNSFDSLDRLVEEFGIAIAIHNHGPGHRYAKMDQIAKAIEGHHKLIGVCNDTGHFIRAGEDPVRAVQAFGERTYGVHLKDYGDKGYGMVGSGRLDLVGLLRELRKIRFDYCLALEYEEDPQDPVPGMSESLRRVREAVQKL